MKLSDKEIIKNNEKIFNGLVFFPEENVLKDYNTNWNSLINVFYLYKTANIGIIFSELSNINTLFLLGVSQNNIEKSYNALVKIVNFKNIRTPITFKKQKLEMSNNNKISQ